MFGGSVRSIERVPCPAPDEEPEDEDEPVVCWFEVCEPLIDVVCEEGWD